MKRVKAIVLLVLVALAAVVAGVYLAWNLRNLSPHLAITPAYFQQTLIDGNVTLTDGEYYIQFTVLPGAFDINVSGNFSVLGEGTIRLIVVNATNFVSGLGLPTSYDSGQQTSGRVNATLAPDATYYLVYANFLQWGTPEPAKIVNTDINLSYFYT